MGGVTDTLFGSEGGGGQSSQSTVSGFSALPGDLQEDYRGLLDQALGFAEQPDLFRPMGLTNEEQIARGMIDPANFQQSVSNYLNPFQDFITRDINRAFEDEFSLGAQLANEAGAFGSTRYRDLQNDIQRGRLDAIGSASANQFNTAADQAQRGIANLLGFGGLERSVDLAQRQAPLQALGFGLGAYEPLLGGSQGTMTRSTEGSSSGIIGGITGVGDALGSLGSLFGGGGPVSYSNPMQQSDASSVFGGGGGGGGSDLAAIADLAAKAYMFFSDSRLKRNIRKIGERIGLNVYEFEYLWSPQKSIGFMADEVKKLYPGAVHEHPSGYLMVDYGKLANV